MRGNTNIERIRNILDLVLFSKYKIPAYQHGHVYLTSHRICYVDNVEPRKNSVSIELRDIDRYEFYVRQALPSDDASTQVATGALSQIIAKSHHIPQTCEKIIRSA